MSLYYFRETQDDGYISVYNINTKFNYNSILQDVSPYLYNCDGYTKNKRESAVFTSDVNKISQPLSNDWLLVPPRYKYQKFIPIIYQLKKELKDLNLIENFDSLTDCFINLYNDGDFIAFHRDHHDDDNHFPIACILSFEKFENENHILSFYRTVGDVNAPTKKERGINKEEFDIKLNNNSLVVMHGMQKKYVHSIKPGKPRISVVFTFR